MLTFIKIFFRLRLAETDLLLNDRAAQVNAAAVRVSGDSGGIGIGGGSFGGIGGDASLNALLGLGGDASLNALHGGGITATGSQDGPLGQGALDDILNILDSD